MQRFRVIVSCLSKSLEASGISPLKEKKHIIVIRS